jgi:hypothetical protein
MSTRVGTTYGSRTGLSPSVSSPFQRTYTLDDAPVMADRKTTIREILGTPDLEFEPCPVHSPLLRTSWLVSFPPVINMLKFTG